MTAGREASSLRVLVGASGRIESTHGNARAFGLELTLGADASEALPFLVGSLPLDGRALRIARVELGDGRCASVELLPAPDGTWVLLEDRSLEAAAERDAQAILHARALAADGPEELFEALGVAVFVARSGGLHMLGEPPAWWGRHFAELGRAFEASAPEGFLAHVVEDAAELWDAPAATTRHYGPWSEGGVAEGALLDAVAVRGESGTAWLVVRHVGEAGERRRRVLQRAREDRLAFDRFERDVQRKEVLLHLLVHDLRGPLSSVLNVLSLLESGRVTAERSAELLEIGLRQGRRQLDMLESALDTFRAEVESLGACATDAESAPDLAGIARDSVAALEPAFERAGVSLELVGEGARLPVAAELRRLERVFANLLDNACKHAPRGSTVRVEVWTDGDEAFAAVADQGHGVAADVAPRLFTQFGRTAGERGGTGLGLYYCRLVLEAWGGGIELDAGSGEDPGARFVCRLRRLSASDGSPG